MVVDFQLSNALFCIFSTIGEDDVPEDYPADYIVLGLDVISYSKKDLLGQKLAQEAVDRFLQNSLANKWAGPVPHWIDAGDGGFVLFQGAELAVLEVLQEIYKLLDRENRKTSSDDDRVFLRAALHKDQIIAWSTEKGYKKYTGHALNHCARLMAGMAKEHKQQVVCSRPVIERIMALDDTVVATRLRDTKDKHGLAHEAWNISRSPGFGVAPLNHEVHQDPLQRFYN